MVFLFTMDESVLNSIRWPYDGKEGQVDVELIKKVFGFDLILKNVEVPGSASGVKLLKRRMASRISDLKCCKCEPINGKKCMGQCRRRGFNNECPAACDEEGVECQNRGLSKGIYKKMKLVSRGEIGLGVVACEPIEQGDFIIEYTGVIYHALDNPLRSTTRYAAALSEGRKLEASSCVVLEATEKGNMSRYMNHSHRPNATLITKRVGDEFRLGVFACEDISPGTEITYNYGEYYRDMGIPVCKCGEVECPDARET